jgi:hypothetical protein
VGCFVVQLLCSVVYVRCGVPAVRNAGLAGGFHEAGEAAGLLVRLQGLGLCLVCNSCACCATLAWREAFMKRVRLLVSCVVRQIFGLGW